MQQKKQNSLSSTGSSAKVLIPVDFSPKGFLAVKVGFELSRRLGREVELIHASTIPDPTTLPQFPDDFNGMDNESAEIEEMEMSMEVRSIDEQSMNSLKEKIKRLQSTDNLPRLNFNSIIAPGMPEEVIAEYCSVNTPEVIVMATRGKEKRKEELIGSVTVEVIDHNIAPVFAVPEDYTFIGFKEIVRICAFCYFDEGDFHAIEKLMTMFGNPEVRIYLFPASDKLTGKKKDESLRMLKVKLEQVFQNSEFVVSDFSEDIKLREQAEIFFTKEKIQMILAPNRKRNAISRFFNPGLAHKILYEVDIPMLAIPV